jgi:hypothetical protein
LDLRDWQRAKELIEEMKDGQDDGNFGYENMPIPGGC